MAKVRKAATRPALSKMHKSRMGQKYLQMDFSKVLWPDEMSLTLDGPDGWLDTELHFDFGDGAGRSH